MRSEAQEKGQWEWSRSDYIWTQLNEAIPVEVGAQVLGFNLLNSPPGGAVFLWLDETMWEKDEVFRTYPGWRRYPWSGLPISRRWPQMCWCPWRSYRCLNETWNRQNELQPKLIMYGQFSRNVPLSLYGASISVCAAMQKLYQLFYGFPSYTESRIAFLRCQIA